MRKTTIITAAIILILTISAAIIHKTSQEDISCMIIHNQDMEIQVTFDDLNQTEFSGDMVNGKGEVSHHTFRGILLSDLLKHKDIDLTSIAEINITSADNYTASYTIEEIMDPDSIYIAVEKDQELLTNIDGDSNGTQIIAFCDENSRRCVRYATIIDIIYPPQ